MHIFDNMCLFVSADRLQNNDAWRCSWTVPGYVQDLCVDIVPSTAKPCTVRLGLPNKHENGRSWKSKDLLGQRLNFKLFGITYLVGKIKFKLLFQGPLAK